MKEMINVNKEQQELAINYSIKYLEGELKELKHAQRINVHDEIKELLQGEIDTLEDDLSMFKEVQHRRSYQ